MDMQTVEFDATPDLLGVGHDRQRAARIVDIRRHHRVFGGRVVEHDLDIVYSPSQLFIYA